MRSGPLSSIAVLVLLVPACTSTDGAPSARPGVPPERIGATGARCPDDHPIVVLDGVAFPPGHPDAPVLIPPPDRCFLTLQEAMRAGYPTAGLPAGARRIGDIYLTPTGGELRADCIRLARTIHLAVACPQLLPSGASLIPSVERGSAVFEGGSPFPPGHDPEAVSHLWVISTRPELAATLEGCSLERARTPTTIHRRPATFIACGEASELHGGHVLVVWREGGASHAVSVHGVTPQNRRMVRAIAQSVELIRR